MRFIDFDPRQLHRFDLILAALVFGLMLCGVFVIWGVSGAEWAKADFARRQLVRVAIGLAVFFVCCFIDLKTLELGSWVLYVLCLLALGGLLVAGHESGGAMAWYRIGTSTIQPAEFAKIATVLVLASYLASNRDQMRQIGGLIVPGLIVAPPFLLVVLQNDTGTALIFAPVLLVMIYMAGMQKRILGGLFIVLMLGAVIALPNLKDYQLARIAHVMGPRLSRPMFTALNRNPDEILARVQDNRGLSWQSQQTLMTLGSGRVAGKGWGKMTETSMTAMGFLPSKDKDTVFASLGEQFGMIGCLLVILGYALIIWRGARIALNARDMFCSLMVVGLLTVFIVHIIINVGMNVDLLPIIGIPLPFLSYGGSFILALSVMFGLIVNVGMRKFIY